MYPQTTIRSGDKFINQAMQIGHRSLENEKEKSLRSALRGGRKAAMIEKQKRKEKKKTIFESLKNWDFKVTLAQGSAILKDGCFGFGRKISRVATKHHSGGNYPRVIWKPLKRDRPETVEPPTKKRRLTKEPFNGQYICHCIFDESGSDSDYDPDSDPDSDPDDPLALRFMEEWDNDEVEFPIPVWDTMPIRRRNPVDPIGLKEKNEKFNLFYPAKGNTKRKRRNKRVRFDLE